MLGFELLKNQYVDDEQFCPILVKAVDGVAIEGYYLVDIFLYKGGKLCIPNGSVWELLVCEAHAEGLSGHLGEKKTFELVKEHFYWRGLVKNIHGVIERCVVCKMAKGKKESCEEYMPLLLPTQP